jgi:coenzyme F420-reducing hydrogenase alpha subunit
MTERNIELALHHITRVEGHGNINIKVSNGVVKVRMEHT